MELTHGSDLSGLIKGQISEEKQVHNYSVDLTVREVFAIHGRGGLDFSGADQEEPKRKKLEPSKKDPSDEHSWWNLNPGVYLVTLNESIDNIDGLGLLSPHPRLLKCGTTHPTLVTHEWKSDYILPLTVGQTGIRLKQNSRISKLLVIGY